MWLMIDHFRCQRAYENYRGEMEGIETTAGLLAEKEVWEIDECREPYSCDERREVKVLLSCGGPSDGYKIYFDKITSLWMAIISSLTGLNMNSSN